jgi:hypothetical protein
MIMIVNAIESSLQNFVSEIPLFSAVINQMKLCDDKLFSFLTELLKPHPPTTPTPSTNPALIASVAYVCGCLMSGNYQGQNLAREKRLLHRLITVFK